MLHLRRYRRDDALQRALAELYITDAYLHRVPQIESEYLAANPPAPGRDHEITLSRPWMAALHGPFATVRVRLGIMAVPVHTWHQTPDDPRFDWSDPTYPGRESPTHARNQRALSSAVYDLSNALNAGNPDARGAYAMLFPYRVEEENGTASADLQARLDADPEIREMLSRELAIVQPDVLWVAIGDEANDTLHRQLPDLDLAWQRPWSFVRGGPYAPLVVRSDHPVELQQAGLLRRFRDGVVEAWRAVEQL